MSKWLIGWLEGFKFYNGIYKRKQYNKAMLVNIKSIKNRTIELYIIITPYFLKNIYNINKTGLY